MTNRLMISVAAAALLAGAGFANAQGTGTSREAPSAEHAVPSSATPMNRNDIPDRGANRSGEKMQPQGGKNQCAQDNMKANPRGEKSAQEDNMKNNMKSGEQPKGKSAQTEEKGSAGKDMKAEGREDRNGNMKAEERGERKGNMKAEGREDHKEMKAEGREERKGNMNAESKGTTESKTVGQAGAGAKLSSEQRTKITTVIRDQHVAPVNNVNFSIAVGTRVPHEMSFHPLPTEIVNIYPDWRGYEFILVRNQIIVVDPQTFEIVAVLDA
jgi:hypothetical protein